MRRRHTVHSLVRDLAQSCERGRDIAARLQQNRIRGFRASPSCCPLAQWLQRRTGHFVLVGIDWIRVWRNFRPYPRGAYYDVPVPGVVAAFLRQFDRYKFRDLRISRRHR